MKPYKTAEARALAILAKKSFGSMANMFRALGSRPQFSTQAINQGLPLKYAGVLGRKFQFHPAILCYDEYLKVAPVDHVSYDSLLSAQSYFSQDEVDFILKGVFIKDSHAWQRQQDKKVISRR